MQDPDKRSLSVLTPAMRGTYGLSGSAEPASIHTP
jgi:hypothetical protein